MRGWTHSGVVRRLLASLCLLVSLLVPTQVACGLDARSEQDIQAKWRQLRPRSTGSAYGANPRLSSPFLAGTLKYGFLRDGLNSVNYGRYLAGMPDDVVLDASYTTRAQHGAVLLAVGQFAHTQPKPAGMSDAFYKLALSATKSSNIGWGHGALWAFNFSCLRDQSSINIDRVGHRRWLLNPRLAKVGLGYADTRSDAYVFDTSRKTAVKYDSVKWPAAGCFPAEMFQPSTPWSITLNPAVYSWTAGTAGHTVTLRRLRDGKTWRFTSADTNKSGEYFHFDTRSYGVANCFIFRPSPASVGAYRAGDSFDVTLSGGIRKRATGKPAVITYRTKFIAQEP